MHDLVAPWMDNLEQQVLVCSHWIRLAVHYYTYWLCAEPAWFVFVSKEIATIQTIISADLLSHNYTNYFSQHVYPGVEPR